MKNENSSTVTNSSLLSPINQSTEHISLVCPMQSILHQLTLQIPLSNRWSKKLMCLVLDLKEECQII
jgi:hypothetical protein